MVWLLVCNYPFLLYLKLMQFTWIVIRDILVSYIEKQFQGRNVLPSHL